MLTIRYGVIDDYRVDTMYFIPAHFCVIALSCPVINIPYDILLCQMQPTYFQKNLDLPE